MTPHQNPETGASGHDDQCCCSFCLAAYDARSKLVAPSLQGGEAKAVAWRYRDAWGRWAYCHPTDNAAGPNVITEKQPLYAHPKAPELDRALALVRTMLTAIEAGQIDSPELDGEPEVGTPPHRWHEEWEYSARAILALASKQGGAS